MKKLATNNTANITPAAAPMRSQRFSFIPSPLVAASPSHCTTHGGDYPWPVPDEYHRITRPPTVYGEGTVDLLDPAFWLDPYPVFAELRRTSPVLWHEEGKLWSIARHGDVVRISRDPLSFCSGKGVLPSDRERGVTPEASMLFLDPPEHHRYRKLVSPAFTPRRIAAIEERVGVLAEELLDGIERGAPV